MKTLAVPTQAMSLVDDDSIVLLCGSNLDYDVFRIRVWRASGTPAVVLITSEGQTPPKKLTVKLANLVNTAYLAHDQCGFYYFEQNEGVISCYAFVGFGRGDRLHLDHPKPVTTTLHEIEVLVGSIVEM